MTWLLPNHYLVEEDIGLCKPFDQSFFLTEVSPSLEESNYHKPILINTGGTISSLFDLGSNGVNVRDIALYDPMLRDYLKLVDYRYHGAKLSEYYSIEDLYELKKLILKERAMGRTKFLFFHGTDNMAIFSSWLKVLARYYKFSAIVMCAQRSWDKPTCELHSLLKPAYFLISKLKERTCYLLCHRSTNLLSIHDPFFVRKVRTYSKDAFYSFNAGYYSSETNYRRPKNLENLSPRPLELDSIGSHRVGITNLFQVTSDTIALGTGLGNFSQIHPKNQFLSSVVREGVLESEIYSKSSKHTIENFSYESLLVLRNLTEYK